MNHYRNHRDKVHYMFKRELDDKNKASVSFNVLKGKELKEGDIVEINDSDTHFLAFSISEITENRQSALTDYNYVTAICDVIKNKSITFKNK